MIIQEVCEQRIRCGQGDKLISFDMTLVEMELNIAKLKLQKQWQGSCCCKEKTCQPYRNGGPILDSDSSSADNLIDSGEDSTEDDSSDLTGDDELSSAVTASDHYLAAVLQPMLLAAVTDGFADDQAGGNGEITSADTETGSEDIGSADEMTSGDTGDISVDTEADSGDDSEDDSEYSTGDPGTASGFYDEPSSDGFSSDISDTNQGGFSDGSNSGSSQNNATIGNDGFVDGEEPFYLTLDYDTEPYQGTGTEEDPYLYLCSSAKGKVNVTGAFLNKMAGYNADGTILLHPGGYWYLLEFHQKDTIADYTNRKGSCTGYYLVDGNMLSNPVDRFAEMDFTLDGAMQYDNGDDEPDIPGDGGSGGGSSSLSRSEAIKIQKNRIASLELDVQESEISISKLQKKADRQLITSKLDGIVTTVGDAATGTNSESDSFMIVKSKDGYYVQGTVGELMLDQVKEGTILNCNSYGENGYMNFEAEVIQVSDYAVDGDSSYYYYGDSNPNVSSYNFPAKITDDTVQVVLRLVDIQLEQQASTDSIVLSKAFVRTEDGVSYVYKDDNGVLKKQIVKVKENVNGGAYVLVSGGLSMDDKIAFPYSKSIKEGMKTKEGSLDTFMGYDSTSYGGLG